MWVLSTLILLSPLLQGYCLYTLTTLSCFVCLLFVCTSTTMSYDLFVKLIGLDLLHYQTSGCSSCRWRRRRRQRCRPSPQQRSPQVSPAGACPKFGASFLIFFLSAKKGGKIRPNLRQNPVDRVWVDGPPDQPDLPAVLAEAILGWEMEWGTCQGNLAQRYKSRKSVYASVLIRQRSWSTMELKSIEGRRRCWKNAVGNSNLRRKRCSLSPTTPASVVEQKPSGGK